ncbi:MFS transporter [Nocardia sp. SYP-A9097]|uniref:MFS transporter n=1 Tax=Nocardia sp. SYP-A9097 TaxID=2663237 RepID=UPI00129A4249|nr:MFS transporter [Nocardia sp. SYP-A9097]MRH91725.1 MFS transporter [Nocardia sp. SYP-A9097]
MTATSRRYEGDTAIRQASNTGPAWLILTLVCACQFMIILDSSIVNVALPAIERDLGFTATSLAWVVNGYLLTFAGFMLLGGRAADLFGQRRMLIAGLLVFSAASLIGGLATAPQLLVAARVAQGMGAAMLAPATLAVINSHFTESGARARAFGAWSASGGVGGMAGALAGGAITTGLSWRWVFLLNVPIGAVLIGIAVLSLAGTGIGAREPLDLIGALTGTTGLAALIYGIMQTAEQNWTALPVIAPIGAGVLLLIAFVATEARSAHPMLPLRLLTSRTVAVGNLMLLLFGGITIAMWYFTSLLLQNTLGYSAFHAGLGQTPAAVTFLLIARVAATLLPRIGAGLLIAIGCACLTAGFAWLAQADSTSGYLTAVLGPTLLIAVGIGATFPTLMATTTADAPAADAGIIGGLAGTANQAGGSIGLAILTTAATAAPALGYDLVFYLAAAFALTIALTCAFLPGDVRRFSH